MNEFKNAKENFKRKIESKESDWKFDSDEEYGFAIGQVVSYLVLTNKMHKEEKIMESIVNPFMNAENKKEMDRAFEHFFGHERFNKYNKKIRSLVNITLDNIQNYQANSFENVGMAIMTGFIGNNIFSEIYLAKFNSKK